MIDICFSHKKNKDNITAITINSDKKTIWKPILYKFI